MQTDRLCQLVGVLRLSQAVLLLVLTLLIQHDSSMQRGEPTDGCIIRVLTCGCMQRQGLQVATRCC